MTTPRAKSSTATTRKRPEQAPLPGQESGGHEPVELVHDHRHGEGDAHEAGDLQAGDEGAGRAREEQGLELVRERLTQDVQDRFRDQEPDDRRDGDGCDDHHQAAAQLLEVLDHGHGRAVLAHRLRSAGSVGRAVSSSEWCRVTSARPGSIPRSPMRPSGTRGSPSRWRCRCPAADRARTGSARSPGR